MDFCGFINFDDFTEESQYQVKPETPQRNPKLLSPPHAIIPKKSYSFYNPHEILNPNPLIPIQNSQIHNKTYFKKPLKRQNLSILQNSQTLFFAFEGKKVSLSSLRDYKNINSYDDSSVKPIKNKGFSLRTKKKNFRRLRWTPLRIKARTVLGCLEYDKIQDNIGKKPDRKNLGIRRELIPQTKACVGIRGKQKVGELRISGVMKDFVMKGFGGVKGKDVFVTDFFLRL